MLRKIVSFFFILFSLQIFSQSEDKFKDPKALQDFQYKKEMYGGLRIQTNGISVYVEHGWIKNIRTTHLIQAEYQYYIDFKEKKTKSYREGGRDYTFGLQNRFHIIRVAYGFDKMIADKAKRNGVKLSVVGFVGGTFGLLKPYNLEIFDSTDATQVYTHHEAWTGNNSDTYLDKYRIYEASAFYVGMNKMQPIAGGHAKVALNFDWGSQDAFVKALEAGVMLDVYYKKVPIMVDNNANRMIQIAFFLGFHLGKRW